MVSAIEETQRATEAAFDALVTYLRTNEAPTSEGAHRILDEILDAHGSESPEGHIVAGGVESAEPHEKGSGLLMPGAPIVIDIYPRSKTTGYFADMSRTVCIGTPPAELQKMYDAVLAAQQLGISMVRPGARGGDIHQAASELFEKAGYLTSGTGKEFPFAEGFVHGLGHGVGLEIHEAPRISRNSDDVLQVGNIVTIEPGLYYKHIGGVRLEDMVLVTEDGCRNLTQAPTFLEI
jgi:Xaa-Pro aminopeptidase